MCRYTSFPLPELCLAQSHRPKLLRRVGPQQVAQIELRHSVEVTGARNSTPLCRQRVEILVVLTFLVPSIADSLG